MAIKPGLSFELTHLVTQQDTAMQYGSGLVPVLSTPYLIALMENAAQRAVDAFLEPGTTTVGVHIDMKHISATPVGMEVRVFARLANVDEQRLSFQIEAWDQAEKIGECVHERAIVDKARFMKHVGDKLQAL